jgi:hypothetical protein
VIRAFPCSLFIERQAFIPFLEIFLEYTDCVPVSFASIESILHDCIDEICNIIKPDLAIQGSDKCLECPPGNPFAIGILLPD